MPLYVQTRAEMLEEKRRKATGKEKEKPYFGEMAPEGVPHMTPYGPIVRFDGVAEKDKPHGAHEEFLHPRHARLCPGAFAAAPPTAAPIVASARPVCRTSEKRV